MKKILILGAGGFIGSHLVKKLKRAHNSIVGVDLKRPEFSATAADHFILGDLRNPDFCSGLFQETYDEVYQFAADMGGAGYIFTGKNDADIMHNSVLINLNILSQHQKMKKIFFSSSACIYPAFNQEQTDTPELSEDSAYPAAPDSEYGWEKLFSERLYLAHYKNHGLQIRIARFHNIFGPEGTWTGGKEKAPAAICRKIAECPDHGTIDIWGDGKQTRSFLYIDECLEGIERLMKSDFTDPLNIGSEEMVSIDQLTDIISNIANKKIFVKHVKGPQGVRGRNSDNRLIRKKLNWSPSKPLIFGLTETYKWIFQQINNKS